MSYLSDRLRPRGRLELGLARSMRLVILASRGCAMAERADVAINASFVTVSEAYRCGSAIHPTLVIQECTAKVSGSLVGFRAYSLGL